MGSAWLYLCFFTGTSECIVFGVVNAYELSALVSTPVNDKQEFEGVFLKRK